MIAGGIDLSVGSVVALVCVSAWRSSMKERGSRPAAISAAGFCDAPDSLAMALVCGVLLGGLCGLLNGGLITGLGVVPFIITLGSLKVYRGLAKWLSQQHPVYVPNEAKPGWFGRMLAIEPEPRGCSSRRGSGCSSALSSVLALTLRYTLLGRYVYADRLERVDGAALRDQRAAMKTVIYGLAGLADRPCRGLPVHLARRHGRPDDGQRAGASGDRGGRDRWGEPERRRRDRPGHPDRLPDHVGPQ